MVYSMLGFPVLHHLPKFAQIYACWVSDAIQPSHPLSSASPPTFNLSQQFFSNGSAIHIRWPKYWSFSFSLSPSSEHSELISFRIDWFDLPAVQGTSQESSSTSVWKQKFFGTKPSLWSNSHIHTRLLEKPPDTKIYQKFPVKLCISH